MSDQNDNGYRAFCARSIGSDNSHMYGVAGAHKGGVVTLGMYANGSTVTHHISAAGAVLLAAALMDAADVAEKYLAEKEGRE